MHFLIPKNKKKLAAETALALAALVIAMPRIIKHGSDFDAFLNAGHRLINFGNIYCPPFIRGIRYYYSPFFALLLAPFSYLPYAAVAFVWLLMITFFLHRSWVLIMKHLDLSLLNKKESSLLAIATIFLVSRFAIGNYMLAQSTPLILWATLESLWLFKNKKHVLGGFLFAFGCTTKILPIVFLPYLLYRGKFKAFTSSIVFSIVFLFIPAIFIGVTYNNFLLREWWQAINPFNAEFIMEPDIGVQNLISSIPAFLTKASSEFSLQRNLFKLTIEQALFITKVLEGILVLAALYFLKTRPFQPAANRVQAIWECAYLFLVTPLLFPRQHVYSFIYVLPAIVYLLYYIMIAFKAQSCHRYTLLIFFVCNCLIFTPIITGDLIGWYAYSLLLYYKVLSFAVIGLSIFLAFCTPKKLERRCTLLSFHQ